jgi:spermidine synthase
VFSAFSGSNAKPHVAIVGLGVGSMACYGEPGQHFTFYEIDPAVQRMASDRRHFTFLHGCRPTIEVVLGDARRSLESAPDRHFGLFVLDAFSSDVVPVHLLTREALGLYLRKLGDGGVLAFHISNRHLELQPVLEDLARGAGLVGFVQHNLSLTDAERRLGAAESQWVVMARRPEDLGPLARNPRWSRLSPFPRATAWSDDFSNTLSVVRWR